VVNRLYKGPVILTVYIKALEMYSWKWKKIRNIKSVFNDIKVRGEERVVTVLNIWFDYFPLNDIYIGIAINANMTV
jgi:hypothetical protein